MKCKHFVEMSNKMQRIYLEPVKLDNIFYEWYSKPIRISQNEFVIFIESTMQLMKYNTMHQKWNLIFDGYFDIKDKPEIIDWSTKKDFTNVSHIGYKLNDDIVLVDLLRNNTDTNRIFIHFGDTSSAPDPNKKYLW